VEPIINYISGHKKEEYEEIIRIINGTEIFLAPNDSAILQKTFNSIYFFCNSEYNNYERFYNETGQLIYFLREIHKKRPCHVGFYKIIKKLEYIYKNEFTQDFNVVGTQKVKDLQKKVKDEINQIEADFRRLENDDENTILHDKNNIFLIGFSEMVSNFINKYSDTKNDFKNNVNIYVLELGGKRRFLRNNVVEYNDGIKYAKHIKKLGFKNVNLLPDTSFPSLLCDPDRKINGENSITLLGANGIDANGNVAHSSGHLMVAIISERYNIPLKVIANKFKTVENGEKINWNLSALREVNWLTGQKNILKELKTYEINLISYLEDKIPSKLITLK
jgi:translation initiation factor 2B subunit (eIF-2B alpha/beta/delta family)